MRPGRGRVRRGAGGGGEGGQPFGGQRAEAAASGAQVVPELLQAVRSGVAPGGADHGHVRRGRRRGRSRVGRPQLADRPDILTGLAGQRSGEEGVQQPLAGMEPQGVTDAVEGEASDGAQADAALPLPAHQQLPHVPGLDGQVELRLLAVQRLDAARFGDQVHLERRAVEDGPVVGEVDGAVDAGAGADALQDVVVGAVVVDAARDALDGARLDVQIGLHGVGVARGGVQAAWAVTGGPRAQGGQEAEEGVVCQRAVGEVPVGGAFAVPVGGRERAVEHEEGFVVGALPQVPGARLEAVAVLGREELHGVRRRGTVLRGPLLPRGLRGLRGLRGRRRRIATREVAGHPGDRRLRQQGRYGHTAAVPGPQGRGQLGQGEGGGALVPQVQRGVQFGHADQVGQQRADLLGQFTGGRERGAGSGGGAPCGSRWLRLAGHGRPVGLGRPVGQRPRQGVPVQLAVVRRGEGRQERHEVRDHVVGQGPGRVSAQLGHGGPGGARFGDQVRDHAPVPAAVGPGHHHRVVHGGVGAQPVLDLAEFDPEAADLHLVVASSQEHQDAVVAVGRPVPGGVHAGVRILPEGLGDEPLPGQFGLSVVAEAEAVARDVEVTLLADGAGLHVPVEYVVAGVVDGPAVRDAAPLGVDVRDGVPVGPDGGLGGAAETDHPGPGEHLAHVVGEGQRDPVAAEEDQAQVGGAGASAVFGQVRGEPGQGGGRGVPEGDRLAQQGVDEQFGVALLGLVGNVEAAAVREESEDVEDGQVEAEGGDTQPGVARTEVEGAPAPVEEVVQGAVRHHHALRAPGAAGGEQPVGDRVRAGDGRGVARVGQVRPGGPGRVQVEDVRAVRHLPARAARRDQQVPGAGVVEHAVRPVAGQ
ncbi:hypothetical protein STENM36S_01680 [Streptomyces tendae]